MGVSVSILTQNSKNQNTNYRKLFKETLENDMITFEKNQVALFDGSLDT